MIDEAMFKLTPTDDHTIDEVLAVAKQAAAQEGREDEVTVVHEGDHDVVAVPRNLTSFPPKNSPYNTSGLVELVDANNPSGGTVAMIEKWEPTVDHR